MVPATVPVSVPVVAQRAGVQRHNLIYVVLYTAASGACPILRAKKFSGSNPAKSVFFRREYCARSAHSTQKMVNRVWQVLQTPNRLLKHHYNPRRRRMVWVPEGRRGGPSTALLGPKGAKNSGFLSSFFDHKKTEATRSDENSGVNAFFYVLSKFDSLVDMRVYEQGETFLEIFSIFFVGQKKNFFGCRGWPGNPAFCSPSGDLSKTCFGAKND